MRMGVERNGGAVYVFSRKLSTKKTSGCKYSDNKKILLSDLRFRDIVRRSVGRIEEAVIDPPEP